MISASSIIQATLPIDEVTELKIEAKCQTCDRVFLLTQIGPESDAPGRCPFCGARFGRHYTTLLVESVDEAEAAVRRFVSALGRLQGMETGFDVDIEGVLREVEMQVRARETRKAG